MDAIVALAKRRGFIFQSSEIYGGFNGFFDYGPLGSELKKNIRDCWWNDMVRRRDDIVVKRPSLDRRRRLSGKSDARRLKPVHARDGLTGVQRLARWMKRRRRCSGPAIDEYLPPAGADLAA